MSSRVAVLIPLRLLRKLRYISTAKPNLLPNPYSHNTWIKNGGIPHSHARLEVDGGGGVNTLSFGSLEGVAEVHDVDLTVDGNVIVTNFRIVESGSLAETRFVLDASSIAKLSLSSPALIRGRTGDRVVLEDLDDWLVGQARVEDGQFIRQITNVSTGQVLDLDFPMPWHNPLRPSDVNNDGVVASLGRATNNQ